MLRRNLLLTYIAGTKSARPHLQKVNLHHITRKRCFINTGLLTHGIRVMAS